MSTSYVHRYNSEDPTWSGIGARPAKRQAYPADAATGSTGAADGGASDDGPDGAEGRWAVLIGSARSRVAAAHEAAAAPQQPQAPSSGAPIELHLMDYHIEVSGQGRLGL